MRVSHSLSLGSILCISVVRAIDVDVNSADSLVSASKSIVQNILGIYNQSDIPGLFSKPYYWWEGGLAFNSLINYYSASGDESIVSIVQDGMLFQSNAPDNNFMPPNQSLTLANDDQASWGLAAMTAAETGFPQRADQNVSWLELAENVFNGQVLRWDLDSCNGGLKWAIYSFNNGYNYKNSPSQGSFALLAARLARFTGNSTYSEWAEKATQWSMDIGIISDSFAVYDGTDDTANCTDIDRIQWTMNTGLFLGAAAYALNATNSSFWSGLTGPLVENTGKFFTKNDDGVLFEVACAAKQTCNTDQLAFRAPLVRALASARDLDTSDSSTTERITAILRASARGAAAQCSGGDSGSVCGLDWSSSTWDGTKGLGQDISALEVLLANLPARQLNSINATSTGTADGNGTTTTETGPDSTQTDNGAAGLVTLSGLGSWGLAGMLASAVMLIV